MTANQFNAKENCDENSSVVKGAAGARHYAVSAFVDCRRLATGSTSLGLGIFVAVNILGIL
jgi:hypothetical protein